MNTNRLLILVGLVVGLSGCVTERIIERPVPISPPSLCLTDCPYSTETPVTNGDLALQWRERGEVLQCYAARLQCVREMAGK